jgi:uncharacterized protein
MASLYDITVPMFIYYLKNLDTWLTKAEEHAKANNVPLTDYVEGRLAPDMAPLTFHLQAACNFASFVVSYVGGQAELKYEEDDTTFEEFHKRIANALDFFGKVKREDLDGKQDKEVTYRTFTFTGLTFCTLFAIPSFYFHLVTTYE